MTTPEDLALGFLERRHLERGGRAMILFKPNIEDPNQLRALTNEIACAVDGPALVAIDQEFSPTVRRLTDDMITPLPLPEEALEMTLDEIHAAAVTLGAEMLDFGINVDLAPVIDVVSIDNPVLRTRHLGDDPDLVGAIGAAFVTGLLEAGVVPVPKHFPGHGGSETDPHYETSVILSERIDLESIDWPPFVDAFAAGAPAVLVGHPVYPALDALRPASLSAQVYRILRDEFAFGGVAITDALAMKALEDLGDPGEIALMALEAGADLLLLEDPEVVEEVVAAIRRAVVAGDLPAGRLIEASARVDELAAWATRLECSE
ncbi:MAG TPA: glycoside hydrolase family 3 N-terminal domain-containing protein [Acidimicrobiia bacterium]|nr:glycoside hydrolase family 3 N-terminal domain-containing protein [Acidimicrobiia bacterium]